MDDDGLVVPGEMDVQLQGVGAQLERPLEGGDGVLGRFRGGAAMGDDEGPGVRRHCRGPSSRGSIEACRRPCSTCSAPRCGSARGSSSASASRAFRHIPKDGPLLVTPNHVTFADPPLVSIPIRRPVHYMAWDKLFDVPGLSWMIRRLRAFPVDIDSADPGHPRGRAPARSGPGRDDISRGAPQSWTDGSSGSSSAPSAWPARAGVPVLPVTILGGHESWPPGRVLPRPGRLTIVYHPVITPPPAAGDLRHAARELADRVREAVASRLPTEGEPPAAGAHA